MTIPADQERYSPRVGIRPYEKIFGPRIDGLEARPAQIVDEAWGLC
jgi:hypothetical protein